MENPNLKVLLLGWDETTQANGSEADFLLQTLASQTSLTAILPHLPTTAASFAYARIRGLDALSAAELAALTTPRPRGAWQAPAAPYVGTSAPESVGAPANLQQTSPDQASMGSGTTAPADHSYLLRKSPPDLLAASEPTAAEPGAAEAHDLSQPADDLVPDAPAPIENLPPIEFSPERATLRNLLSASPEAPGDLNFQVIQYTRYATHVALREDFGVIYAPEWPVWLAGLEIRQLTGKPLVLHVHSLALDRDTPDDRGWVLELERLALRRATLVLAASETLAQRLQSAYDVDAARIRVVPAHDEAALTAALSTIN